MICEACKFDNSKNNITCEQCHKNLFKAKLRITTDSGQVQLHYLFPQKYTIGRSLDNDIVIGDTSVSRNHSEIEFKKDSFYITDNDSKNGSLLNNNRFKNNRLYDLDCIQLGNAVLHFIEDENKLRLPYNELKTEEWVQKELFKFAQDKQFKITTDDVLLTMIDLASSLIHADQAMILQFDQSNKLRFKVGKKQKGQKIFENKLSDFDWTLINDAIRKKDTNIVFRDIDQKDQKSEHSIWYKIAIPLISKNKNGFPGEQLGINGILGAIYFTQDKKTHSISHRKQEILSTIVQQITYAVQNDMLYEHAIDKRKIEEELVLAKEIQQRLLPTTIPNYNNFEIASFIQPCETISGDYFDFIPISSNTMGIAIGDICGKGVPAALLTSTVQAAIHSQLEYTISPNQIIENLNRLLIRNTAESIFLTLFFGIINIDTCEFKYINAGHPPPVLISKDLDITELSSTTPPLGILEDKFNPERTIKFIIGDILILYTDGIIECQNKEKKIYSRKRLIKLITSSIFNNNPNNFKPEYLVKSITNDMTKFIDGSKQKDDLTLLSIKRY